MEGTPKAEGIQEFRNPESCRFRGLFLDLQCVTTILTIEMQPFCTDAPLIDRGWCSAVQFSTCLCPVYADGAAIIRQSGYTLSPAHLLYGWQYENIFDVQKCISHRK